MHAVSSVWPGRYVNPENLHMTLCFVGEVEPNRLKEVQAVGRQAAAFLPGTPLTLMQSGYFGRRDKGILHLTAGGGEAYKPVAQQLRMLLERSDLPHDPKPFVPHITLARNADIRSDVPVQVAPVCWTPQRLTLFHSHRIDGILTYTPLMQWQRDSQ